MELRLTEAGRSAARNIAAARREKFAKVFESLPEDQRGAVLEALGVLEEAMRDGG
jgi:DNA-binding MarR family transcriptional regulator